MLVVNANIVCWEGGRGDDGWGWRGWDRVQIHPMKSELLYEIYMITFQARSKLSFLTSLAALPGGPARWRSSAALQRERP